MTHHLLPWWPVILLLGATRLTQLIMHDKVLDVPRTALLEWSMQRTHDRTIRYQARALTDGRPSRLIRDWIAELLGCVWCVSMWVAIAVTVGFAAAPRATVWVLLPFVISELVSIIDRLVDRIF